MNKTVHIIGAGLSGLVAATELLKKGFHVTLIDQEPRQAIGGQAYWSFGGLFLVNSKVQRRYGVKDSYDLALNDWMGSAQFDRLDGEDYWAEQWAKAYVKFATYEKEDYLHRMGIKLTPILGWAERGGSSASGHGNSVPRFHITWGTGPDLSNHLRIMFYNKNRLVAYHIYQDIKSKLSTLKIIKCDISQETF